MLYPFSLRLPLLAALLLLPGQAWSEEPPTPLARYMPSGAIAAVEGRGWDEIITRLEHSEFLEQVLASPTFKAFDNSPPGRKLRGGIAVVQFQYGKDLWSLARDVLGGEWILAIYPQESGKQPNGVFLIRATSPDIVSHLRTRLEPLVQLTGDKVTSEELDGGGLRLANVDDSALVLQDRWIIGGNRRSLVDQIESALQSAPQSSLASTESYASSVQRIGADTRLQLWIDYQRLREHEQKDRLLPDKLDNPLVSLFLGGVVEYIAQASTVSAGLDITADGWELHAFVPGQPESIDAAHQTLLPPAPSDSATRLGEQVARLSLSRDWAAWYGQREALLEEKLLPEFDKFETGLANLMPGKDFRADILPLLSKRLQIVSAPQSFAQLEGRPGVQLPAFALIMELEQPEPATDLLQMLFQTITAVINLQAGQEKRTPWVVSSETYHDVQISFAKYLQKPKGTDLGIAYNFQPSSARVGRHFIMATSQELCRQLIDALQSSAELPPASTTDRPDWAFELAPTVVADLLESNRAVLEAKTVQNGQTPEQATQILNDGVRLLRHLRPLSLSSSLQPAGYVWRFQGGW